MKEDETITIDKAPVPRGPYVHARKHGGLVYVTGQIGRDAKTGDFVKGGFEAEFNQAIDNLEEILKASGSGLEGQLERAISNLDAILADCGSSLASVIKTMVMVVGDPEESVIDAVFARRFPNLPARTVFGVAFLAAEPGHESVRVQLDCVAS